MKQIITHLTDTDLYKFSMGQTIFHQFNSDKTTWTFKCRNKDVKFTPEMVEEIKNQIKAYCDLRFTEEELDYLKSIPWIHENYVDFLRFWHPRYEEFEITTDAECGLAIETKGTWLSNDCGVPALNIVMKVTRANGQPVAKISDTTGKGMCKDSAYVDYLQRSIDWRMTHEQNV